MEPLSPEDQRNYVDGFAALLGHDDPAFRDRGRQLLGAMLRLARFASAPNVSFPAFGRPEGAS